MITGIDSKSANLRQSKNHTGEFLTALKTYKTLLLATKNFTRG